MTTVAVYVRVSSEKQADDDRTSLSDQQRHCEGFADKQGWHAPTVHSDTFSGYDSLDARVGLRRALDTITQGAVLLVWRFDRLSRDMVDMALIAREVHRKGARIVSVSEGELTNSPMGRLLGSLHTFAAESEREGITARTHGALRTRAEQGKLLVGPSNKYGYSYDGARKEWYVANPETAPVVQRMYALAEQGYTLYDIAKTLNDEGILTRSGYLRSKGLPSGNKGTATVWTRQSVYEVLTDRTYCGRHAAYNKQQVKVGNHKVMRPRPEDDGKRIAQPNVPALVSAETWDTVRAKLQSHMLGQVRTDEYRIAPLLTRGFGICGHCGARVTITKHDKGWYRYHCPNGGNRAVDPAKKCPGGSWAARVSLVDADIWGKVEEMAGDLARFKRMVQAPVQTAEDRVKAVERRQELLQAELAAAYREKDNLARRYGAEDDEDLAAVIHGRVKDCLPEDGRRRVPQVCAVRRRDVHQGRPAHHPESAECARTYVRVRFGLCPDAQWGTVGFTAGTRWGKQYTPWDVLPRGCNGRTPRPQREPARPYRITTSTPAVRLIPTAITTPHVFP